MATSDRLDSSLAGGLSGLRAHMDKMRASIQEANAKADAIEKERADAHHILCRVVGKQQAIKQKITNTEENIEKKEKRVKETEVRVLEKEKFVKDSREFAESLKIITPNEGVITQKENELHEYKEIYHKNYERYQKAKAQKIELEQKYEHVEARTAEIERKLNSLKLELEYNLVEEGRRSEGCKESIDSAFRTEKSCLDLQRGLDAVMKRKEISTKKINDLESQISRVEDSLETTNFERRRIEATIRELLLSAKEQYKDM